MDLSNLRLNIPGLIAIANEVNEAVCKPIADDVAARAKASAKRDTGDYAESIHVETDPRTGAADFAHQRVVASNWKASILEARNGTLSKALGGA